MIKIAVLLNVSHDRNLHDAPPPPFLIHNLNIDNYIFHVGMFQECFNSKSKNGALALNPFHFCNFFFFFFFFY